MNRQADGQERVCWSEGLLLSPQHFQQQDRFHCAERRALLRALWGPAAGAIHVALNGGLLTEQVVGVSAFTGLMPDGTWLQLTEETGALPAPREVAPLFSPTQDRIGVFLALRRQVFGEVAGSDAPDCDTRYRILTRSFPDESAVERVRDIAISTPNVQIMFSGEELGAYSTLKVAELVRDATGAIQVDPTFVPPCLAIGASPCLTEQIAELHRRVAERGTVLRGRRHQHHATEALFRSADITDFLMLQTLHAAEAELAHVVARPACSPEDAYRVLARLAGKLAPFVDFAPSDIPSYRADDLRGCLFPLLKMIRGALDAPSRDRCMRLALDAREDGVHFGELQGPWLQCSRFFLAVRSGVDEAEVVSGLARLSKVSAWSKLSGVLAAATPGVPLSVSLRPPAEIPARAGTVYFELDVSTPYWHQILSENNLAVYLPSPFSPTETSVELIAVAADAVEPRGHAKGALGEGPKDAVASHVFTAEEARSFFDELQPVGGAAPDASFERSP